MGLTLHLSKRPDRQWFTSLDDICGSVSLANNRPIDLDDIMVYLEGKLIPPRKSLCKANGVR